MTNDNQLGQTVIAGPVADQAALHGLLVKVRDLGLTLIAVNASSRGELGLVAAANVGQALTRT